MKCYWYDHKAEGEKPKNATFRKLTELLDARQVEHVQELPTKDPFVCFAHPGDRENDRRLDWEGRANPAKKQFVALLSFGGTAVTLRKAADGVICLHRDRLRRQVEAFELDPGLVADFQKSADAGEPDWKLMGADLAVCNLIALYLIRLANKRGQSVGISEALEDEALVEYRELAMHCGVEAVPEVGSELVEEEMAELLCKWGTE